MKDFTATNGVVVRPQPQGGVYIRDDCQADSNRTQALREFFQAEADERLGRWRWPKNPDYVVQPFAGGSGWNALCESTCVVGTFLSRDAVINSPSYLAPAVLAYIDAHPEPKPWHDARFGEVWIVDTRIRTWGGEQAMFVSEDRKFHNSSWSIPVNDPDVRSARRIWPEVSS